MGERGSGTSNASRAVSLLLVAAILVAPSLSVAIGLLVASVAVGVMPGLARRLLGALARSSTRRAGRRRAVDGGIVLGTGAAGGDVALSDRQLAAHALIVGASGAGKSTTMLGILCAQIERGRPVLAIDMKGSPAFAAQLERAAAAAGRRVRVWSLDGPAHWNPLAHGNPTSLKDKLICTERFSEPHYQRAAERYVQTVLQVVHAAHHDRPAQLDEVVSLMEPRRLASTLRAVPAPLADRVQDYLGGLTGDQISAIRGLGTRLALLSESCAGEYLRPGADAAGDIDLRAGLEGGDVILFSLNSSVYGKLAAQLGALVIQDLVSATGHRLKDGSPPLQATVGIDEFSALGADNVLALIARGRESGVNCVLATQEMSDLERAGRGFRDQVLGIVGIKIAHRQDVPDSALTISQMAGTDRVWERTEQLHGLFSPGAGRGTRRQVEQYVIPPNEIKTLPTGSAVVITKLPTSAVARVRVDPPGRGGIESSRAGRDQPAPGVTR